MKIVRTFTLCNAAAILLSLSLALPAPAAAQPESYSQEEFARIVISQGAQAAQDALVAEQDALRFQIRALDAIQENYGKYVVKTGDVFRPLSEEDVERLEAFFGLRVFLRSHDRKIPEWPDLGGESQLRNVMAKAEAAAIDENSLPSSGPIPHDAVVEAGLRMTKILRAGLETAAERNFAEIEARKQELEAKIAEIEATREALRRLRNETRARQAQ